MIFLITKSNLYKFCLTLLEISLLNEIAFHFNEKCINSIKKLHRKHREKKHTPVVYFFYLIINISLYSCKFSILACQHWNMRNIYLQLIFILTSIKQKLSLLFYSIYYKSINKTLIHESNMPIFICHYGIKIKSIKTRNKHVT